MTRIMQKGPAESASPCCNIGGKCRQAIVVNGPWARFLPSTTRRMLSRTRSGHRSEPQGRP